MQMNSEREQIYILLDEIGILIRENEQDDKTFRFDPAPVLAALDFTKAEIIHSIRKTKK